jgi:FAD/FMN-containing dehydrogenase
MTPRGLGTDQSGAAIGTGIMLVFPAHMNRINKFDTKTGIITVEPGINYGKLQQTLFTHGRFLPPYPSSIEFSTIGGAVASNSSGEKSFKYGDTRSYVKKLRVVLANGEVIETGRLSKHDLNKKLGLANFEGEIYRAIDTLLEEKHQPIKDLKFLVTKNASGYNLKDIRNKQGFDLTPLFVGSQGTLGIITEIQLETEHHNPQSTLLVGMFNGHKNIQSAIIELRNMSNPPSLIEIIDENLLNLVDEINPNQLKDVIVKPYPKALLFIEFDDTNDHSQRKFVKKAAKILQRYGTNYQIAEDENEKSKLLKIRQSTGLLAIHTDGKLRATPFIDDGIVPLSNFEEYLTKLYELLERNRVRAAVWGHAGDGNLSMQPYLDISQVGDRQKLFRLMDEYYDLVISLGGMPSAEKGDGRIRGSYLPKAYGQEIYEIFQRVKSTFDPYGTLNPGVKIGVTIDSIKPLLRDGYKVGKWYDYLPRP